MEATNSKQNASESIDIPIDSKQNETKCNNETTPTCLRCTGTDRKYQLRLMEAKAQAPIQRILSLESTIQ